jgi:hypothetical protein
VIYETPMPVTGRTWTLERVTAPANLRLYHAVVSRLFVLQADRDIRREVQLLL